MRASSDNGNNERLMRIGDLARKAGTTMRTIRYYEQLGLITPATRTRGGFRLYEEDELRKLRLIKNLQLVDTPLSQVKAFFDLRREGRVASEISGGLSLLLKEQLRQVEQRIAQFQAMESSLRETIEILRYCANCSLEPGPAICPHCPVITSRSEVPLHMRAVIELTQRANSADTPLKESDGSLTAAISGGSTCPDTA